MKIDTAKGKTESCGQSAKRFLAWPGHGENSIALQAPDVFRLGLEVLTGTRLDEVMRVGAFVSGAWTRTGVFGSGRVQGNMREFVGVEGGQNKNERAEAAGTSGSSGETRKTTATCFAPR